MKRVDIYSDGSCLGNPGPGGWCAILLYQGHEKVLSGFEKETTNNRMEIMGAIKGIEALKESCFVNLYTDSAYVVNAYQEGWLLEWKKNGWKTKARTEVKNKDLWEVFLSVAKPHILVVHKVKGHADNPYNIRCDEIARKEASKT